MDQNSLFDEAIIRKVQKGYKLEYKTQNAAVLLKPFRGHVAYAISILIFGLVLSPVFSAVAVAQGSTTAGTMTVFSFIFSILAIIIAIFWAIKSTKSTTVSLTYINGFVQEKQHIS